MIIQEFSNEVNTNFFFKNLVLVHFIHYFSIFLLNIVSYLYICAKLYKVLCYSKITFEWLPMINPYIWPFSLFNVLTDPYFRFWAKILPNIKLDSSSVQISGIIALEALNSLIYFCVRVAQSLIVILENTEKLI
jgi:uncharacterized protein YggT (Ycf19 family)